MSFDPLHRTAAFNALKTQAIRIEQPEYHLRNLMHSPQRFTDYSIALEGGSKGFFFDYSRQRMDDPIFTGLLSLAQQSGAQNIFSKMCAGKKVNVTEDRPALHTLSRLPAEKITDPGLADKKADLDHVDAQVKEYSDQVRSGEIRGTTQKQFTHAVVVGIGGSYLGCEFVYTALRQSLRPQIALRFLSNVDVDNFKAVKDHVDIESTLWIIISKSYSTPETLANQRQARALLEAHGLDPKDHLVTVTAKEDAAEGHTFAMFDYIGGRYSVSSAVGGLPLSIAFGHDVFDCFLQGCHAMDEHALNAPPDKNIPLVSALINIWNTQFLKYVAKAIIPYSFSLSKLPAHIQQLYMESIGKCVTWKGEPLDEPAGCIIFGEPGSNAQHSFFQLAHQGKGFPVEFIGVLNPGFQNDYKSPGHITNHQELWANLLAQAKALAEGKPTVSPERIFPGNRPSTMIVLEDLSPWSIGCLTAYYEAKTVLEGFILGVNPFDQFGVELGKTLAREFRKKIDQTSAQSETDPELNEADAFYLNALSKGTLAP